MELPIDTIVVLFLLKFQTRILLHLDVQDEKIYCNLVKSNPSRCLIKQSYLGKSNTELN